MNETLKNKEIIRDYLLCRISDEEKLSEIEEFLFSDDEFRTELETVLRLAEENRQNIRKDSERQAFFENEQIVYDAAIFDSLKRNDANKGNYILNKPKLKY